MRVISVQSSEFISVIFTVLYNLKENVVHMKPLRPYVSLKNSYILINVPTVPPKGLLLKSSRAWRTPKGAIASVTTYKKSFDENQLDDFFEKIWVEISK